MDNELDGLKAIYPCVTVVNDKTIDLDIYPYWSEEDSEEHLVSITITVSEGYPEEPPHVRIFALWMKDIVSSLRFAEQAVREAWVAGQPSLFPIIQYIQDNIPQPDQPGPVVGGSIPPPVGTGPPNKLVEETIKIYTGNPIVDKKSIFQAFACRVYSKEDVDLFTQTMYQRPKTRRATHNIVAYRFTLPAKRKGQPPVVAQDHDSDGETAAGGRVQALLEVLKAENVAVMVSRWYGGIQLGIALNQGVPREPIDSFVGPARFKRINNSVRDILLSSGLI